MKNLLLISAMLISFTIGANAAKPKGKLSYDHRTEEQKADTTIYGTTTSIIWVPIATRTYYLEVTRLNGDTTTTYREFLNGKAVKREGYKIDMGQAYKAIERIDKLIYHGPVENTDDDYVRIGSFVGHYQYQDDEK